MKPTWRSTLRFALHFYAAVAGLTFFASALVYLYFGHWTVTHLDFWRIYDECLKRSWFGAALLKYNGHSHFFPSQLWLADLRFFHGNMEVLFYTGLALLIAVTGMLAATIWLDRTVDAAAKTVATLSLVVLNFWMGRAVTMTSGGFNCEYSLALAGVIGAVLALRRVKDTGFASSGWLSRAIVVVSAWVSCFSFGTGLAVWPTLLLLGYRLRLARRDYWMIAGAALASYVTFALLPSRYETQASVAAAGLLSAIVRVPKLLCELIGSPITYIIAGWLPEKSALSTFDNPMFGGLLGLVLVIAAVVASFRRGNERPGNLEFAGLALSAFSVLGLSLIALGRSDRMHAFPVEATAPRYLFWSSLFWLGLCFNGAAYGKQSSAVRRATWPVLLALPVAVFPSHCKEAIKRHYARCVTEAAAGALVSGVRDDRTVALLFRDPRTVYRVSNVFRARSLDMFRSGSATWFGRRSTDVLTVSRKLRQSRAYGHIAALLPGDDDKPAARINGWANPWASSRVIVVDEHDLVCGVGAACVLSPWLNRTLYGNKFEKNAVSAYVHPYDANSRYRLRCVEDGRVSPITTDVVRAAAPR